MFFTPDPPAFLGCAPSGGPITIIQMKQWATGLLEIFFLVDLHIWSFIVCSMLRNYWIHIDGMENELLELAS